ncbi:MAG: type III-B CRISPR-associated protein Cas10/Cmr2, partial [Elainella sp.]
MNIHQSKLYAFLTEVGFPNDQIRALDCFADLPLDRLPKDPPDCFYQTAANIAKASDRLLFQQQPLGQTDQPVRHLISGQTQTIPLPQETIPAIPDFIQQERNAQVVFLWFWRFYAELQAQQQPNSLLDPADPILPDCPRHSYASTVSALITAMPPEAEAPEPYLLLFTFSPIQEFIKASRKFLDFWAGSYLLHYLSADLCWYIAQHYGPDMVITPSLWSQEIIDALILQQHSEWAKSFRDIQRGTTPVERFEQKKSSSLSTAGFPNTITVLAASKAKALELGQALAERLRDCWQEISQNVRRAIKDQVRAKLEDAKIYADIEAEINEEFDSADIGLCIRELEQYKQHGCWEWNSLWDAQIDHTWEPYYVAVPLGHPDPNQPLQIKCDDSALEDWIAAQNAIVQPRVPIPAPAELEAYETLNVGTWWGNYQSRLGQLIQVVKNTRTWQIAAAPGERSSLSGQYSAVHPRFNYAKFPNGRGMTAASMRLFWLVMKHAFPGLFNGTEKLNALELTKRMAWREGGVAQKLGLPLKDEDYENLIRFPNLSSIAAARFATDRPAQVRHYWSVLNKAIQRDLPRKRDDFGSLTRRPFQVRQADAALNPD